jgi:capsular polysaccharide biosynthesis protein
VTSVPLRIVAADHMGATRVSRSALVDARRTTALWEASREESHDFMTAFDRSASDGLDREPIAERLRDSAYTSPPLRFLSVSDCYVMPAWGVVFDANGTVNFEASRAAQWHSPDLSILPGVVPMDDHPWVTAEALENAVEVSGGHLLLHHAGLRTYGHWMADCILGAWVFADEIRRGQLRLLAAPLDRWHRQTLEAFGIAQSVTESAMPLVRCEQLIIPSSLDISNITRPTHLLGECFRALRRGCPPPRVHIPRLPRLYIARGSLERRPMRNERALIAALEERGFVAVYPRGMSIAQQVHLFSGAECIVGPSGSAMINTVYMDSGSHVVEISPIAVESNFWVARLGAVLGIRYAGTIVDVAVEDRSDSVVSGGRRESVDCRFDADIPAVLRALDVFGFR